jgi:hypothetical protein
MEIIRIKSELPNTHFAPSYDIRMGAFQFDNQRVYERIHDFLLDKESFILELEPNNDAGTGVDNTDITNRFGQYNVFHFIDECKELKLLLDWLRNCYLEFMHSEGTPVLQCDMVCWYNILRDNKNLNEHVHSCNENSYLSGNMQLSKFETVTNYRAPQDSFNGLKVIGPPGQLVIFPSYVPHGVKTEWQGERISLAFDLYGSQFQSEPHWGNSIRFMDEDIFKRLTNK